MALHIGREVVQLGGISGFHRIISLGTACGDSVFCSVTDFCESSGAASGDPFVPFDFIASFLWAPPVATQFSVVRAPPVATLVISYHRIISVGTACGDSVFFSVIQCVVCSGTISGDSFMSFEFIASFVWAPPVATQFSVLSYTTSTHTYIHTHICEAQAPPVATL